jgi:dienelactone hydrolase
MSVTLARRWAGLGFRVLRFDIAGLGESPADAEIGENQVYSNGTARDSLRALDFLERTRGANRFVCAGLCSGAFFSFHAALADERVVGMMLLNIQLFHWRVGDPVDARKRDVVKSQHFYRKAAFERQAWARLVRGQVDVRSIAQGILHNSWEMARQRVRGALLGESDVARGFRTLLQRGTDVLLVLSADDGARNTVDAHLGVNAARFHRDPRFRIEIIDGADHTFTPLACQDVLVSLLTNHLVTRFGAEPAFAAGDRLPASGPAESVRMTATR